MRSRPGYHEPPRVVVLLFIGLLVFGPAIYGYNQGGFMEAVLATALAYTVYFVAAKLMVIHR